MIVLKITNNSFASSKTITYLIFVVFIFALFAAPVNASWFGEEEYQKVQIVDPYIEMHTGPGRGFPIFHVVDRHEWVEILKRKTDWFKVRTDRGKTGWVKREQIERTLTEYGYRKSFRDVLVADYLRRRFEFGISSGDFEDDPFIVARLGYRLNDNLLIEFSYGEVAGDLSSSDVWNINLVSQPFPDWIVTPNFSIGYGKFKNTPRATLINAVETKSDLANAGIGARFYLTERFFIRADARHYVVLSNDNENDKFTEVSGGIGFFF